MRVVHRQDLERLLDEARGEADRALVIPQCSLRNTYAKHIEVQILVTNTATCCTVRARLLQQRRHQSCGNRPQRGAG